MRWFKRQAEVVDPGRPPTQYYKPMEVVRTVDGHLVPAPDESWDDIKMLQWRAGLLKADTGFAVTFYQPSSFINNTVLWDQFGMVSPFGSALSSIRARDFWLFAVGVEWALKWAKNQAKE